MGAAFSAAFGVARGAGLSHLRGNPFAGDGRRRLLGIALSRPLGPSVSGALKTPGFGLSSFFCSSGVRRRQDSCLASDFGSGVGL